MKRAIKRVIKNKGAPGVDGMTVRQVKRYLQRHWNKIENALLDGTYQPKQSAHDAVLQAKTYLLDGYTYVVDMDLSKFFDRVNHDRLMSRLATKIRDKRVLKLIRRYLMAGIMIDGLVCPGDEGTPQGGLCKALHKPPYAKLAIMQSKSLRLPDLQHLHWIYFA